MLSMLIFWMRIATRITFFAYAAALEIIGRVTFLLLTHRCELCCRLAFAPISCKHRAIERLTRWFTLKVVRMKNRLAFSWSPWPLWSRSSNLKEFHGSQKGITFRFRLRCLARSAIVEPHPIDISATWWQSLRCSHSTKNLKLVFMRMFHFQLVAHQKIYWRWRIVMHYAPLSWFMHSKIELHGFGESVRAYG